MANRYFKQFMYSFEKMPVKLFGIASLAQLGQFATLVNQGLTYTAVEDGVAGNDITIALIDPPGNNVALSIAVSGTDIVVTLATDGASAITTTATQLQAALAANAVVSALISVSGSGGSALTAVAETNLAGGVAYTGDSYGIESIRQTGTGAYEIKLQDKYEDLLGFNCSILKSVAADLNPQLVSETVDSTKLIAFRTLAGATPTTILSGNKLFIELALRNTTRG